MADNDHSGAGSDVGHGGDSGSGGGSGGSSSGGGGGFGGGGSGNDGGWGGGWGDGGYGGGGWGTGGLGVNGGIGGDSIGGGFGGDGSGFGGNYGGIGNWGGGGDYGGFGSNDAAINAAQAMMEMNASPDFVGTDTPTGRAKVARAVAENMGFSELSDRYGLSTAIAAKLGGPIGGFAAGMFGGPLGAALGIGANEYAKSKILGESYSPADLVSGVVDKGVLSGLQAGFGPIAAKLGFGIAGLPGAMLGSLASNYGINRGYGALKEYGGRQAGFGNQAGAGSGFSDGVIGPMGFQIPKQGLPGANVPTLQDYMQGWNYEPPINTNRTFT